MKKVFITLFLSVIIIGCVETITDNTSTSSSAPTIELKKPITGDTVVVGKNKIEYSATDGANGGGLTHYEIFLNDVFIQKVTQNTDGTNPNLYLNVDSTSLFKRIKYYVIVYNKAGKLKVSKVQENIFVKESPPKAPGNLVLTRINDYAINLLWDDSSSNETNYEVWRKDGLEGNYRIVKTLPKNIISTNDEGLSAYIDYSYKVRATNNSGASGFSNEVSTSSVPGGIWNLQAEAIGASSIRLTWNDFVPNELGFIIERQNSLGQWSRLSPNAAPNTTEYFDTSVQPSLTYKYRIAYYTASGVSGYSNEISVSTYYTDVPNPKDLIVSYNAQTFTTLLKWSDVTTLERGVSIERKTGSEGAFKVIGSTTSDVTQFTDNTIEKGNTYYYRIRYILTDRTFSQYSNTAQIPIPN